MDIDVFGRKLRTNNKGTRGPPGVGYKFTPDGQFDVENKRLCNVAAPVKSDDAVNLQTLKRLLESDVRSLYEITANLRNEIDNFGTILKAQKIELEKNINDFTSFVEAHRDEIDKQILDSNAKVKQLNDSLDFIYSGRIRD